MPQHAWDESKFQSTFSLSIPQKKKELVGRSFQVLGSSSCGREFYFTQGRLTYTAWIQSKLGLVVPECVPFDGSSYVKEFLPLPDVAALSRKLQTRLIYPRPSRVYPSHCGRLMSPTCGISSKYTFKESQVQSDET